MNLSTLVMLFFAASSENICPIIIFFSRTACLGLFRNETLFMPPRPRAVGLPGALSVLVVRTCLRPSEDQVKIFGPGRISRPISGSKLIFHTRIYLYERSRNLQEPWPCDLYFMVHWLRLRVLAQVDSQNLLVVESSIFTWGYISMRGAGMTSWPIFHSPLTSDFGQFSKVKFFVQGRIWSPIIFSKLIFL